MISLLVVLFISLSLAQPAPSCGSCSDGGCVVQENVRVKSLCAEELCVDGNPIVAIDDDPCTSDAVVDGVLVSVPIKDCCKIHADCEKFIPDGCYHSQCLKEDGSDYGFCLHIKLAAEDCCKCDADCPERPCMQAQCVEQPADQTAFVKLFADDNRMTLLTPGEDVMGVVKKCEYTDVRDLDPPQECCTKSEECKSELANQVGLCDKDCKCVFVTATQFECTEDSECQEKDVSGTNKCRAKGNCWDNVCDRGWCTCLQDKDVDADGDGVCCKDDCDDHDDTVGKAILCPEGQIVATGEEGSIDFDGDGFYQCGIWVQEICALVCPNGAVPLNETQVSRSRTKWDKLYLAYDCDCCDNNAGGPDEEIWCGRDDDGDGVFAPIGPDDPEWCAEKFCALVPDGSNKKFEDGGSGQVARTTDVRDAQCANVTNGEFPLYVPPDARSGDCDECDDPDDEGDTPGLFPIEVAPGIPACTGANLDIESCCAQIIDLYEKGPQDCFEDVYKCCKKLDDGECPGLTFPLETSCGGDLDDSARECLPDCDEKWPTYDGRIEYTGDAIELECVYDKDHDKYFNCDEIEKICIQLPVCVKPKKGSPRPRWNKDDDEIVDKLCDDEFELNPETKELLCQIKFGKKWPVTSFDKAVAEGDAEDVRNGDDYDGTLCDCDDKDEWFFEERVCVKDADKDGQPPRINDEGSCKAVCGKCPPSYRPWKELEDSGGCSLEEVIVMKKRSLENAAAKHSWYEKRNAPRRKPPGGTPDLREDESCDDLACEKEDCCDKDNKVFIGSTWAGTELNKCGSPDNNCDQEARTVAICGPSPGRDGAVPDPKRTAFFDIGVMDPSKTNRPSSPGTYPLSNTENPASFTDFNGWPVILFFDCIGACTKDIGDCETRNGWGIKSDERKRGAPAQSSSTPQTICDGDDAYIQSDDRVDATGADDPDGPFVKYDKVALGHCVEFLQSCTPEPDTCNHTYETCKKASI